MSPLKRAPRRTFIRCPEHGRVEAYVFERKDRPPRADGTRAKRIVCPYCRRLDKKAWLLFKPGARAKMRAADERYREKNRARYLASQKAYNDGARKVTQAVARALLVLLLVASPWHVSAQGVRPGNCVERRGTTKTNVAILRTTARPLFPPSKKKRWFDPCRVSPFFCGVVPWVR